MTHPKNHSGAFFIFMCLAFLFSAAHGADDARGTQSTGKPIPSEKASAGRLVRDGIAIDFTAASITGKTSGRTELREGDTAEIAFRITGEAKKEPMRFLRPGAWLDIAGAQKSRGGKEPDCQEKVSLYLKGIVGMRAAIDLNSYFIFVLNREPNISVIDPYVGFSGKTNLYAMIQLKQPGADWVRSRDGKRLYVTLPKANQVAVVDTDLLKVERYLEVGENPNRVTLQPDGEYLWVGTDAREGLVGGVTLIDAVAAKPVATLATGKGHHEIAFSPDSRYAYVTNRSDGTVSVVDVRERRKTADLKTGPMPISLNASAIAQAIYVADGQDGTVAVVPVSRNEVAARIPLKPGLGPLRFTPDGRWGFVLNARESEVAVIDASTNRVAHTVTVGKEPYQIEITPSFAHILSLGTEIVSMIPLVDLGKDAPLSLNTYPAGSEAPGRARDLTVAQSLSPSIMPNEMLVVNPADRTIYDYMEGMNFPRGSFRSYGQEPRSILIVDKTLKEAEPGVYSTRVKFPVADAYDVVFLLDSPKIVHCFRLTVKEDPGLPRIKGPLQIEFLSTERQVKVGESVPIRFRIVDPETKNPRGGLADVRIMYYSMPGSTRSQAAAREVEEGVYEAILHVAKPGAHYVYVTSASLPSQGGAMPFYTLTGVHALPPPKGP